MHPLHHMSYPLPISAFAHALRGFHIGHVTQEELFWEMDRQLAIEKASPVALLEIVKIQQVAQPLAEAAHDAIIKHLLEWLQDPTVPTGSTRVNAYPRSPNAGVGDILQGRFSLVSLIGEGGMSRIFKAIDLRRVEAGAIDPYVAVKVLTEPFSEYFGSIVALQRETHKLESLSHPNIVRVIDCDRDGHTVFMTMEFLSGESLQTKLRAPKSTLPRFDAASALALVVTIGNALQYAHRNYIVHGDLKPGNVIITDKGVVKLIDFGMARFMVRPDHGLPVEPSGEATPKAVTPRYASPEMVAGSDPEPADDVYALACIAYEVLSGKPPFAKLSDTAERDPRPPPRPPGMRRSRYLALVNALAFDRTQRTASIQEFLDQLRARPWEWLRKRTIWLTLLAVVAMLTVILINSLRMQRAASRAVATRGGEIHDCPTCPAMTVLPAARFLQGTPADSAGAAGYESPQHAVKIDYAFAMNSNLVTVGEFREFAAVTRRELTGCNVYDAHWQYQKNASWLAPGFAQSSNHPVTCVSWDDATAYAAWLSEKYGHLYRLPSSSEWEYAARAGSALATPWGANPVTACAYGNVSDQKASHRYPGWRSFPCSDGYVYTSPVGSFKSNALGLNDMLGNVLEWVQDCWHDDYVGAPTNGSPRLGLPCDEHELRGGSWYTSPDYVTTSYRNRFTSTYRSSTTGFRLVREIDT